MHKRKDIDENKALVLEMIERKEPKVAISNFLKCKPETLNGYLKEWGIDYKGNPSHKGEKGIGYIPAKEYFDGSRLIHSANLIKKLFNDGIKERRCERCGLSEWCGNPIPLELHHINGNRYDNHLENLQILCPNCHALTDNYRGKK